MRRTFCRRRCLLWLLSVWQFNLFILNWKSRIIWSVLAFLQCSCSRRSRTHILLSDRIFLCKDCIHQWCGCRTKRSPRLPRQGSRRVGFFLSLENWHWMKVCWQIQEFISVRGWINVLWVKCEVFRNYKRRSQGSIGGRDTTRWGIRVSVSHCQD